MIQIFKNANYDWLKMRHIFLLISAALLLGGLCSAMIRQLVPGGTEAFNLGVDFQGGTVATVKFLKNRPTDDAIRQALNAAGIGESVVQSTDRPEEVLIKVPQQGQSGEEGAQAQVDVGGAKARQALNTFGAEKDAYEIIQTEAVGPVAGRQLRNQAIIVTLLALVGVLLYIGFRFEWTYGAAAVITVFHDVLVTVGFFSVFQWEVSLTVIAALLTLVGFSVNDTIVTFDRVRENLRLRRRASLYELTNEAINQTLSRTIITGGLVFLSVLALVLFGGEVLWGFSIALFIGTIVGTYSTIAIASPIMVWLQERAANRAQAATPARREKAVGATRGTTPRRGPRGTQSSGGGVVNEPQGAARS
ncbi:MAG TPA: protein translocase subunit SecF [Pyrinomonadaceae bacterium]|nr:protein translocase subunit SecF [Pyrinomonadaceae bacterium]